MGTLFVGMVIYVCILFVRMHLLIKKYKINFKYMFLNYIMLGLVIVLNLPPVLDIFTNLFSIYDRFDVMGIIMFIYLMYNNIMLEFHIARINQDFEYMVSKIALIKKDLDELQK